MPVRRRTDRHPFLYQRDDQAKFLLGRDGADVQRNAEGIAVIGDPRNDSHMLMSNCISPCSRPTMCFVDEARLTGVSKRPRVRRGSAPVTLALSMDRFLTSFCPRSLDRPLQIRSSRRPTVVPPGAWRIHTTRVADAAYRYGHAQIRHRYQLNLHTDPVPLFPDLLGFRAVPPDGTVDWKLFFDAVGTTPAQRSRKLTGNWCAHSFSCL